MFSRFKHKPHSRAKSLLGYHGANALRSSLGCRKKSSQLAISSATSQIHRLFVGIFCSFLAIFASFWLSGQIIGAQASPDANPETGVDSVQAETRVDAAQDVPAERQPDSGASSTGKVERDTGVVWTSSPLTLPVQTALQNSWPAVAALLASEDYRTAQAQLESLLAVQHDQGIRNFVSAALAVQRAARKAVEAGEVDAGIALAQSAQKHAPDLPIVHLGLARLYVDSAKLAPGPMMAELAAGIARLWTHLPTRIRLLTNFAVAIMLLMVVIATLFVLVVAVRYTVLLGHDLKNFAPRGVSGPQMALLFVVLTLLPLVFGVGFIYVLFLWLAIFWLYMSRREKVVTIVLLLAFAGLAKLNDYAVRLMGYQQTWQAAAYDCTYGLCEHAQLTQLYSVIEHHDDPLALLTLGLYHHRLSPTDSASATLTEGFLTRALSAGGEDPYVLTAVGNHRLSDAMAICKTNAELAETRMNEADEFYRRALDVAPTFLPALYNRSHLLRRAGNTDDADAVYRRAQSADDGRLYFFERQVAGTEGTSRCPALFNVNRQLMTPGIPDDRVFSGVLAHQSIHSPSFFLIPFSGWMVGAAGHTSLPVFAITLVVIVLALGPFRSALRATWFCPRCGKIANTRENPELEELDDCDECLLIRVKGAFVDPKDLWFRQRRIEADKQGRRQRMRLLTFLLPGAGHLYGGRTLRGMSYSTIFVFLLIQLVTPLGVIRDPLAVDALMPWPRILMVVTLAAVAYGIALADIYAVRDPHR